MLNVENGWNAFINFENYVFNPENEDFSDFIEMWNNRYELKMDIFCLFLDLQCLKKKKNSPGLTNLCFSKLVFPSPSCFLMKFIKLKDILIFLLFFKFC